MVYNVLPHDKTLKPYLMIGCLKQAIELLCHSRRGYKQLFSNLSKDSTFNKQIDKARYRFNTILASN